MDSGFENPGTGEGVSCSVPRMQTRQRYVLRSLLYLLVFLVSGYDVSYSQLSGTLFRRVSRVSNFEFAVYNNGMVWGFNTWESTGWPFGAEPLAYWPRGTFHMYFDLPKGFLFLATKSGLLAASEAAIWRLGRTSHGPFDQMVPGRIGDPRAGYDSVFNGAGWLYVDDPDYIVYSSLDYDSTGVDVTGNNFNDWPIRLVNGETKYVADPLERSFYPPVYVSDEDMFCIFKDTDTRADDRYSGPGGGSVPIGIEVHNYVYTWADGPAKDIVLFRYDVVSKSQVALDSCYVVFSSGLHFSAAVPSHIPHLIKTYEQELWRNLTYVQPVNPVEWSVWTATAVPPTIGFPAIEVPQGYSGAAEVRGMPSDTICYFLDSSGTVQPLFLTGTDSVEYRTFASPPPWLLRQPPDPLRRGLPVLVTGPFPMSPNDTAHFTVAYIFSDSLPHLLLMDDFIRRVYNSNFQRPSPPPAPTLTATGLNRAVNLSWDNSAELATDIIIPDTLGKPFRGYRLLRAQSKDGPYVQLGRWVADSGLVHEYLDRGEDLIGGLKNNVRYYYRLLSFDEGAPRLKLDPMESPPADGLNSVSVVPATEPSNATSSSSDATLLAGTLGDVAIPRLVPINVTNFNNLVSGRTLTLSINATTNGITYTLPVTIADTISGRVHNAIVDPGLFVHGSPQTAGIKQATARITNVFGIGATDVELSYRFEQLGQPYTLSGLIESTPGADVPVIINDSLGVTGILTYSPYTSAARELLLQFTPGGLDTVNRLFNRIVPYLGVQLRDVPTGLLLRADTDYTFSGQGIRTTGGTSFTTRRNRYYLSGTLSNGEQWDFGHTLSMYNSAIGFDYPDHGVGSGKPPPYFRWASPGRAGTRDFQSADRVRIGWQGGVRSVFPQNALLTLVGAPPARTDVTGEMMEKIRIVPNPYMVRHEAQRGEPRLYFNYLPEECTIRIYTVALDLVKTIPHSGGSREEWDLTTEGGQLVASQMFVAHIEAPNGKKTIKKFAVVVGK